MSDIRKLRSELKQSLHQHLMHFYQSYRASYPKEQAQKMVTKAIHEELAKFGEDPTQMNELHVLGQIESRFLSHEKTADPDQTAFIQDTILAIDELKKSLAQEEEILRESKTR